jgi:hypothetical protein
MNERQTRDVKTVTVIGSQPMVRPDGRAAIRLETRELGPIAFEVDERAIEALRQAIASAETHLQRSKNQTRN